MESHRTEEEVDPRARQGRRDYERIHGEVPPINPAEARSEDPGAPSNHPYPSIMSGADLGVSEVLEDGEEIYGAAVFLDGDKVEESLLEGYGVETSYSGEVMHVYSTVEEDLREAVEEVMERVRD